MKTLKFLLLIVAISGVFFTGCRKNENLPPVDPPKTMNDLKAPAMFNWSTEIPVEFKITGLPTIVPVKSTLTISRVDGTPLYSSLHLMDQNLTINLTVPSTETQLVLKYGSVSYPVAIMNKQASFSFIPVIEEK